MIIPIREHLSDEEKRHLFELVKEFQVDLECIRYGGEGKEGKAHEVYFFLSEDVPELLIKRIEGQSFIKKVKRLEVPYKILSQDHSELAPKMNVGNRTLKKELCIIAGPCTIDEKNPQMFLETAAALKEAGVQGIRGGVWKPRTSPYSYRGGDQNLQTILDAKSQTGLPIALEVMDEQQAQLAIDAGADILQVGARNALNLRLLQFLGKATAGTDTIVLLKRSIHMGKVDELILAAEYIAAAGNHRIALCPRGTSPAMQGYRFHPDEAITQLLQEKTWAPVIVDPSHSVGKAKYVSKAAMAAVSYGADGLLIESHITPEKGVGDDPKQALSVEQIQNLVVKLEALYGICRQDG